MYAHIFVFTITKSHLEGSMNKLEFIYIKIQNREIQKTEIKLTTLFFEVHIIK